MFADQNNLNTFQKGLQVQITGSNPSVWLDCYKCLGFSLKRLQNDTLAAVCGRASRGLVAVRTASPVMAKILEKTLPCKAKLEAEDSVYFCLLVPDLPDFLRQYQSDGFEVLGEGSLLLLPPSPARTWNVSSGNGMPKPQDFIQLKGSDFERLLNKSRAMKKALGAIQLLEGLWKEEEELVLALAGVCASACVPADLLLWVLENFFEKCLGRELSPKFREAVDQVYNAWAKGYAVPGWKSLTALGWGIEQIRELLELLSRTPCVNDKMFLADNGTLYEVKRKGETLVGPAVALEALVWIEEGKKTYRIWYAGESRLLEEPKDLKTIRELSGRTIVKESWYLEWLDLQMRYTQMEGRKFWVRTRTGWSGKQFYHPLLQPEDLWDSHQLVKRGAARIVGVDKQHRTILEAFREGMGLGGVLLLGASAAFLRPLGGIPYCVFITGPSGVGKTTLALAASSPFYLSDEPFFTANSTVVGMELGLKEFQDLPVLFDEVTVREADLERVVFMTSSRRGRTRGTKQLSLTVNELNSVVFLTSEFSEVEQLKRAGAQRRLVLIELSSWEKDVSEKIPLSRVIEDLRNCSGAGLDWIRFVLDNPSVLEEAAEAAATLVGPDNPLAGVCRGIWGTLQLLERYYGEKFERLRHWVEKLFGNQLERFFEKTDLLARFYEEFGQFLSQRIGEILFLDGEEVSKFAPRQLMAWKDSTGFYILTEAFREFCAEWGYHQNSLLGQLYEAGILVRGDEKKFRKKKRVPILGTIASVYHLLLPEDFYEEFEEEHEL